MAITSRTSILTILITKISTEGLASTASFRFRLRVKFVIKQLFHREKLPPSLGSEIRCIKMFNSTVKSVTPYRKDGRLRVTFLSSPNLTINSRKYSVWIHVSLEEFNLCLLTLCQMEHVVLMPYSRGLSNNPDP